ncbi:glutathione peroxidase [Celerinatantimonas sp. YJH-8]|uniref:glutathione peroxidase n=1 Tax=Celerinatantimonas sp. YJH-8 TaxID=3228714 RepID=UPI0038C1FAF2
MKEFPVDLELLTLANQKQSLAAYNDKVLLIVNTASECGFTGQYQELETIYEQYRNHSFSVLGFPCNQFAQQEPGSNLQIQQFCEQTYGVSFPMFDKVNVNGINTHPLFEWLKSAAPGVLGSQRIKWNFTKFLVSADRQRVRRYSPTTQPMQLVADIETELGITD